MTALGRGATKSAAPVGKSVGKAYHHERLAVETPEARETRLQRYSVRYREQSAQPQLPLFQQCSIKAKMRKFHANMATLDTPVCTTCSESFPGLQLHSKSTECLRCSRDKRIPKLYSSSTNFL